jgi:outer membrane biosynthesis protein TonB
MRTIWLSLGVCVIAGCSSESPDRAVWPEASSNSAPTNGSATFNVTATGTAPLSYQWYFNGSNIAGASNGPLVLQTSPASPATAPDANLTNTVAKPESGMATPEPGFPDYDHEIINTILKHWQELRSSYPAGAPGHTKGKVVVDFRLHADGRIGVVKTVSSDVDSVLTYLCQQAVNDLAPYPRWPEEMIHKLGVESREIRFTFYYD